ncbi:MAG: sigma-70 family RNA polymerase sigma factor [Clostridia bacterium]|nr:sigma-70 family RNA polymerase sigma factor [Clostridia bacterium]
MIVSFTPADGKTSDRETVDFIYRQFYRLMLTAAGRVLPYDGQEAEDAVHDAMIKIIKNVSVIDVSDPKRLRNLCCIIARNCALDRLRKREGKNVSLSDIQWDAEDTEPPPDQTAESGDALGAILRAIGSLPERYRYPCILKYVYEYKNKEIAALLGIPEMTVGTRVRRGKMLLHDALRKEGYHE